MKFFFFRLAERSVPSSSLRSVGLLSGVLILALLVSGCRSSGAFERQDTGGDVARVVSTEVARTQTALDRALSALDALLQRPLNDPQEQFNIYASGLSDADASWNKLSAQVTTLREKTDAYFASWDADIASMQDGGMRSVARERRQQIQEGVRRFEDQYSEARRTIAPTLMRMRSLQQMLQNDFTDEGIRAARGAIEETRQTALESFTALEDLAMRANRVANSLAPATSSER